LFGDVFHAASSSKSHKIRFLFLFASAIVPTYLSSPLLVIVLRNLGLPALLYLPSWRTSATIPPPDTSNLPVHVARRIRVVLAIAIFSSSDQVAAIELGGERGSVGFGA